MAGGVARKGGKKGRKIGRNSRSGATAATRYARTIERKRKNVLRSNGKAFLDVWQPREVHALAAAGKKSK